MRFSTLFEEDVLALAQRLARFPTSKPFSDASYNLGFQRWVRALYEHEEKAYES